MTTQRRLGPDRRKRADGGEMSLRTMCLKVAIVLSWLTIFLSPGYADHSANFVVKDTMYGKVRGYTQEVFPRRPVDIFLGVPYASPPVGKLRFEPPQALPRWEGVVNTTELPPACAQSNSSLLYLQAHYPEFDYQSEDCLYLNIFAPQIRKDVTSLPVFVFIHGGSNDAGMGGMFDGSIISSFTDIIMVTMNYRLGPLGFLSMGDDTFSGNYGLLDQLAALRWVRDNIHFFGGDPGRVTLGGHSAGSCDVGLHVISPLAKGLFQSAITQSGAPTASWAVLRPPKKADRFAKDVGLELGCAQEDSKSLKACLQTIPVQQLVNVHIQASGIFSVFIPVVDGHFLPDFPENLMKSGTLNIKRLFTGVTSNEGSSSVRAVLDQLKTSNISPQFFRSVLEGNLVVFPSVPGIVDLLMYEYTDWARTNSSMAAIQQFSELLGDSIFVSPMARTADLMASQNISVYMYSFEHRSRLNPLARWTGVSHGDDLFYIFGAPLSGHPLYNYTDGDKRMSEMMMTIWGNYVKYGIPGTYKDPDESRRKFDTYSPPKTSYTRLMSDRGAPKTRSERHLRGRKMAFWNDLLPQLKIASKAEVERLTTVTQEGLDFEMMTWIFVAVSSALFLALIALAIYLVRVKSELTKACNSNSYQVN